MKKLLMLCALAASACTVPVQMRAGSGMPHASAHALASVPKLVVVPAIDFRPKAERTGKGLEPGFIMASGGGGLGHHAGAKAIDGDGEMRWSAHPFTGLVASASTGVAGDIGRTLQSTAQRPVAFDVRSFDEAARGAPDGAIVVQVVIDHLTRVEPGNADFSQTKHQEGNYEVTTTTTSTEKYGPFWSISYRIQLGEVRGGQIVRKQVRYAAPRSMGTEAYAESVQATADEIVRAVAASWAAPAPDEWSEPTADPTDPPTEI